MVNEQWVIVSRKSVNGGKCRAKTGADQKRALRKRTTPYQLVRFTGAFDAGKQEASDKRHIKMFVTVIRINSHCTAYIGFSR